jgi:translation initiation factor 2B subunit (eIF-2B alpha/beta/delta family)
MRKRIKFVKKEIHIALKHSKYKGHRTIRNNAFLLTHCCESRNIYLLMKTLALPLQLERYNCH